MKKVIAGLLLGSFFSFYFFHPSVRAQCVPNCIAPFCGQDDGCGSVCSDTDNLVSTAPTPLAPVNDAEVSATDITIGGVPHKRITLSIQAQPDPTYNASRISMELYPVGTSCAHLLARCGLIASGVTAGQIVNYNFDIPLSQYESVAQYQWRVRHQNSTCSQLVSAYSEWQHFTVVDTVTGNIFLDDQFVGMSGSVCSSVFPPYPYFSQNIGERVRVTHQSSSIERESPIAADGSFSVLAPVGLSTVEFVTDDASPVCACPSGSCVYATVSVPETAVRFYYQPVEDRSAWWQVSGGSIYAGEASLYAVSSQIPDTCILDCKPFVSLHDQSNTDNSSGSIVTGGGGIDTSSLSGAQASQIDEDNRDYFVQGSQLEGVLENYDFFYRAYSMGMDPEDDLSGFTTLPSTEPVNGRAFFRDGSMIINQPTQLSDARQVVVFIDGNLTISAPIRVDAGSFLAFIVKGNITVSANVCQSDHDSNTPVVEGVYVANGMITIASQGGGDCKFVGAGIFAGWSGIDLNRDFRDGGAQQTWNARTPSEFFIYRPDLVANTPERMKRSLLEWQEVAP